MLHLLGIDHEKLTYKHQGRYYRLTDVTGTWSRTCWPERGCGHHFAPVTMCGR